VNATAVDPDSDAVEYQCLALLHVAFFLAVAAYCPGAFLEAHRFVCRLVCLAASLWTFPPIPMQRFVSSYVCRCGAPSSIATLACALLSPLLRFLNSPLPDPSVGGHCHLMRWVAFPSVVNLFESCCLAVTVRIVSVPYVLFYLSMEPLAFRPG
jgi:hypothetical protein